MSDRTEISWTDASWNPTRGCIVGSVSIVGCVAKSKSRWFVGPFGFLLARPRPYKPIPIRGQLGIFNVTLDESQLEVVNG